MKFYFACFPRLGKAVSSTLLLAAFLWMYLTQPLSAQTVITKSAVPPSVGVGKAVHDSLFVHRLQLGVLASASGVRGVQAGLLGAAVSQRMKGVQWSPLLSMGRSINGLQIGGFGTLSTATLRGVQLSAITNVARRIDQGTQVSALANVVAGSMKGVQVSGYNFADTLQGVQIGLINVALQRPGGVQIGVLNYSRDSVTHRIGLFNISPATRIDVLTYMGNTSLLNLGVRFRNGPWYSMLAVGTHYAGFNRRFSGALSYHFGRAFSLTPGIDFQAPGHVALSTDLSFSHIESFEENSSASPKRLYSLQLHGNVDYRFSPVAGLFASVGYGTTRHYAGHRHFRSGWVLRGGFSFVWPNRLKSSASIVQPYSTSRSATGRTLLEDSVLQAMQPRLRIFPHPWRAAAEVTAINLGVHAFDRWALNEEFAQVTLKSIGHNLRNGFVWDNDKFSTNLFAHPYHGNLYFNAARSSGLSFTASAPYALAGSLMWELCGEKEPPALNDLLATTFGGICIGEITHRVAALIRQSGRKHRRSKWLYDTFATAVDPIGAANGMLFSSSLQRATTGPKEKTASVPLDFSVAVGTRYLADEGALFRGENSLFANVFLNYGNIFDEHSRSPYDFFSAEVNISASANQPLINGVHLLGQLWAGNVYRKGLFEARWGLFQHFNYYDAKPVKYGTDQTPYRISEAASLGPGLLFAFPTMGTLQRLEQRFFLSGILLGGTKSDYYNLIDRDYNMGSGFSLKSKTQMEFRRFGRFVLHADYYRLYTWKGYEGKDLARIDPLYLNAQGDKGSAELMVINPLWEIDLKGRWSLLASSGFYFRQTRYNYHPWVRAHTYELKVGAVWHL